MSKYIEENDHPNRVVFCAVCNLEVKGTEMTRHKHGTEEFSFNRDYMFLRFPKEVDMK